MNRGVENRDLFGVLAAVVMGVSGWSMGVRSGDRDRDGEWNCDGGHDMGGLGEEATGRGVMGAELTSSPSPILISTSLPSSYGSVNFSG